MLARCAIVLRSYCTSRAWRRVCYMMLSVIVGPLTVDHVLAGRYTEDGHTRGSAEFQPPDPVRLRWDLNTEACLTAVS